MAEQAIVNARSAGFDNINIDLIYGIPQQSDVQWKENLERTITLKPNHISAYALTVEPKTAFGNWQQKGHFEAVSEDVVANQFELMVEMLKNAGYEQYEVSNFALPGFESRHNSSYWQGTPYLGLGPGAHSFNRESRQFNVSNNAAYIKELNKSNLPYELEVLSNFNQLSEYLFTGLRTNLGINLDQIKKQYHYNIKALHGDFIDQLIHNGQATLINNRLILTSAGFLIADSIIVELMPEE
jgi:oxygen-independent coproporphyrinogen-3 oxidase